MDQDTNNPSDESDPERVWEQGWEGHELEQLKRRARMTMQEKLAWLDEAHRLVLQMQGKSEGRDTDRNQSTS